MKNNTVGQEESARVGSILFYIRLQERPDTRAAGANPGEAVDEILG